MGLCQAEDYDHDQQSNYPRAGKNGNQKKHAKCKESFIHYSFLYSMGLLANHSTVSRNFSTLIPRMSVWIESQCK